MIQRLFLYVAEHKSFWQKRAELKKAKLSVKKKLYLFTDAWRQEKNSSKQFFDLFKIGFWGLIIPLGLSLSLQITQARFNWLFEFHNLPEINSDSYETLLAVATSISGLFIGLYFSAITTITSVTYAGVSDDIRRLVLEDKFSNLYLKYLAFFTVFGVCLLTILSLGYKPNPISPLLFFLASAIATYSFIPLVKNFFSLFNPTVLTDSLLYSIDQSFEIISKNKVYRNELAFQQHEYRLVNQNIFTLHRVINLIDNSDHLNGDSYVVICKKILNTLARYSYLKRSIPTNSDWYKTTYIAKEWYKTNDYEISLRNRAKSDLPSIEGKNLEWLEEELFKIVTACLIKNIDNERYGLVRELLIRISDYVYGLSHNGDAKLGLKMIQLTSAAIAGKIGNTKEETLEIMSLAETLAMLPIQLILGVVSGKSSNNKAMLLGRLKGLNWESKSSMYNLGLSVRTLQECERLYPRLEFERAVEKNIITPAWYIEGLLCKAEAENYKATVEAITIGARDIYKSWIDQSINMNAWIASMFLTREQEYWSKVDAHWKSVVNIWHELTDDTRVDPETWPKLDTEEYSSIIYERKIEIIDPLKKIVLHLSQTDKKESYPDHLGKFSHQLSEYVIDSAVDCNEKLFEDVFLTFFFSCLTQYDKLKIGVNLDDLTKNEIRVLIAPIIDLLEFSGLAILCSEYHLSSRLKEVVTTSWDKYINDSDQKGINFVSVVVTYLDNTIGSVNRDQFRFESKNKVMNLLSTIKIKSFPGDDRMFPDRVVQHSSPIVRVFAEGNMVSSVKGIDVFLTEYFFKRPDTKGIKFGRSTGYLTQKISKEINLYDKHKGDM